MAIALFLLSGNNRKLFQQESDLLEIRQNRSAMAAVRPKDNTADTASVYLNVLAYAPFKGSGNYPAIRPPWGVLNAIDLSTGEYVWKIPVGNDSTLVKKGAQPGVGLNSQPTGLTGSPGPIATAGGLVFIAGGKEQETPALLIRIAANYCGKRYCREPDHPRLVRIRGKENNILPFPWQEMRRIPPVRSWLLRCHDPARWPARPLSPMIR